jgi:hypothetical protein
LCRIANLKLRTHLLDLRCLLFALKHCAFAERDPAAAAKALTALGENPASLGPIVDVRFNRPFMEGIIARMAKDDSKMRSAFTAARTEQEKNHPSSTKSCSGNGRAWFDRGRPWMQGGSVARRTTGCRVCPVERDAVLSVAIVKYLAMIAAWVGEKDLACEQLAIAVRSPGDLSYGQLKLMPFWDPLRGDPRFETIVASLAPK